jgi:serine/threonine protein kinase
MDCPHAELWFSYKHYEFPDPCILPFLPFVGVENEKSGGFGDVWSVRVHPAHRSGPHHHEKKGEAWAIKRPHSTLQEDFEKERDMLNVLGSKEHPHLMKLLVTYRHKKKYHLVFPFASANLREYWGSHQFPTTSQAREESTVWALRQIIGLANSLRTIHYFGDDQDGFNSENDRIYGCHEDIKPGNILLRYGDIREDMGHDKDTNPSGVLLIADFRLGRIHRRVSRSKIDARNVGGSPTYAPPELNLHKPISRQFDIWSLCCLYLEF